MADQHSLAEDQPKIQPEIGSDDGLLLPGYKALSGLAVTSLILGLLSPLSLAHPWLWLLPAAAIIGGLWALYRIAQQPATFTGSMLAKTGLVLGLVFGSVSVTSHFVSRWFLRRDGRKFAEEFLAEIANGSIEKLQSAYWKKFPPEARREMSTADFETLLKRHGGEKGWLKFQKLGVVRHLTDSAGAVRWRFHSAERIDKWRAGDYLTLVYQLDPPPPPHNQFFVMLHLASWLSSDSGQAQRNWVIEEVTGPYVPLSFQVRRGGHTHEQ